VGDIRRRILYEKSMFITKSERQHLKGPLIFPDKNFTVCWKLSSVRPATVQEDGILKLFNKIRYVESQDKPGSYISQANVGFICNNVFMIVAIRRDIFQNTPHI